MVGGLNHSLKIFASQPLCCHSCPLGHLGSVTSHFISPHFSSPRTPSTLEGGASFEPGSSVDAQRQGTVSQLAGVQVRFHSSCDPHSMSAVHAASLAETITMAANAANVHVLSHPLLNTRLAKLRQVTTTSKEFRKVKSITFYSGQLCL